MRFLLLLNLFLILNFVVFGQQPAPEPEKVVSIGDPFFFEYLETDSIKLKEETLDFAAHLLLDDIKLSCHIIIFHKEKTAKQVFERRKRIVSRFLQKKGIVAKRIFFVDGGGNTSGRESVHFTVGFMSPPGNVP